MAWVETDGISFQARHDSGHAEDAQRVLDALEDFRVRLEPLFQRVPGGVTVVLHTHFAALSLAHPWLPLARLASAPAGRRYFAGWFARGEIHVLTPDAAERRASAVPGSREVLRRSPHHEYAHLVLGENNPALPPPFTPATFRRYVRVAWLCEGAATHFSGQSRHLRAAVSRRLKEGPRPAFPPSARDATLLGGTVFGLLRDERGQEACAALAVSDPDDTGIAELKHAFGRPLPDVERSWRDYLDGFGAG